MARSPELVLPDSPLVDAVRQLETEWQHEFGGQPFNWTEAWLWMPADGYALFQRSPQLRRAPGLAGGTQIVPGSSQWTLLRVWLRPELRRCGILAAAWPSFQERYGNFVVASPGPAMQAFLDGRAATGFSG